MAHTYRLEQARASSAANPITATVAVAAGDTVACLMIKGVGATNRAGGAPTLSNAANSYTFTQANSTQKAAASPEASAELWYVVSPEVGSYTLTIPNTGPITCFFTLAMGKAAAGGSSAFGQANGGNGTSANPTPGAVTCDAGDIVFAAVASGATTWAPSAQAGTAIANTDDGAHGGGEQYSVRSAGGSFTLNWTFGTSDDWGAVAATFREIPPNVLENYMNVKVGDGMGTGEKVR